MAARPARTQGGFGRLLRLWRRARGLSQEELAELAGVSARHVCFLENERAAPGRATVTAFAAALRLTASQANMLHLAAGQSPEAAATPQAADADRVAALSVVLRHAEPLPAMVTDSVGNVRLVNRAWVAVHRYFLGDLIDRPRLNAVDLLVDDRGWRQFIPRWDELASSLLALLLQEAIVSGNREAERLVSRLARTSGLPTDWARHYAGQSPFDQFRIDFAVPGGEPVPLRLVHQFADAASLTPGGRLIVATVFPDGAVPDRWRPVPGPPGNAGHPLCCA